MVSRGSWRQKLELKKEERKAHEAGTADYRQEIVSPPIQEEALEVCWC
jgi:hypothetical protein